MSGLTKFSSIFKTLEKNELCALVWSNFSSIFSVCYLGRREDFFNDWRKVKSALRWGTMHSDAESLKEPYLLSLAYLDAEAGLAGVNHRRTPNLGRLNLPKRSL